MIVTQRPVRLYDVDLIGLTLLAVLLVAGYVAVGEPLAAQWAEYQRLAARVNDSRQTLAKRATNLNELEVELEALRVKVVKERAAAPRPGYVANLVTRIAAAAERNDVELTQVMPEAPQSHDAYLTVDVALSGSGTSVSLLTFLHDVNALTPYQSIRQMHISRRDQSASPSCSFRWTVRFFLLPEQPAPPIASEDTA